MALPTTRERVPAHTAEEMNRRIAMEMEARVRHLAGRRDQIAPRLAELDGEWDIERAIEANAATVAFFGPAAGRVRPSTLAHPARTGCGVPVSACAARVVPAGSGAAAIGVSYRA
jgi:hypothetical protein